MNSDTNKHMLWELTKTMYTAANPRSQIVELFERTVRDIDEASSAPLLEKNKMFLTEYLKRVQALPANDEATREREFEDRLRQKQAELSEPLDVIHVKKVSFEDQTVQNDLRDIKIMLQQILAKLTEKDLYGPL